MNKKANFLCKKIDFLYFIENVCREFLSQKELCMQLNLTSESAVIMLKEIDTVKKSLQKLQKIEEVQDKWVSDISMGGDYAMGLISEVLEDE